MRKVQKADREKTAVSGDPGLRLAQAKGDFKSDRDRATVMPGNLKNR